MEEETPSPNKPAPISFGFHKKKTTPLKKPAVAAVFAQHDDEDEDHNVDDTVVETLSLQALTVKDPARPPSSMSQSQQATSPPRPPPPSRRPPTTAIATASTTKQDKRAKADASREEGNACAERGDFRQVLTPSSNVLYELKSQCHLSLEEYLEAVRAAKRAVVLAPGCNDAALTLGRSLLSLGEVRPAVKVLSELLGRDGRNEEVRQELIYANEVLMELRRREADFDLQLNGRAGLDKRELEVARAKRHLLTRGADVSSDCWLGGSEGSEGAWEGGEEEEEEEEHEEEVEEGGGGEGKEGDEKEGEPVEEEEEEEEVEEEEEDGAGML